MSRCVCLSRIYKYRNIVPISGKKSLFTLNVARVWLRALEVTETEAGHSQEDAHFLWLPGRWS